MPQNNKLLHVLGFLVTLVLHGAIFGGAAFFAGVGSAAERPSIIDKEAIEVSLARKSNTESRQPQKERKRMAPPPEEPEQTKIADDAEAEPAEPETKEPEKKPDELDYEKLFEERFKRTQDDNDDMDQGEETAEGSFDGSEKGFASVDKGHPYMREIVAEAYDAWEVPTLEQGTEPAVACVLLQKSGIITEFKLDPPSENANIDRSVRLALLQLQKGRSGGDHPVPPEIEHITTKWLCFNFNP